MDTRSQKRHRGLAPIWWSHVAQNVQEILRIVVYRAHIIVMEDIRPGAFEHAAVLQDVRDARWRSKVVFQHVQLARAIAHEVTSNDVRVDTEWRSELAALHLVALGAHDELSRHSAIPENVLLVIDVMQKQIERPDSLFKTAFDARPLF